MYEPTSPATALYWSTLLQRPDRPPIVVACGVGVDSVAMLLLMHGLGIRPDLILFVDTGDERPETYAYIPVLNAWLRSVGFPEVIVVRRKPTKSRKSGRVYRTLSQNCFENETLPSLAFGRKACSQKWKREPQDKFVRGWEPAKVAWSRGQKVVKLIGYDAGPKDMRRSSIEDDSRYTYRYLLREWGWDRARCIEEIKGAGLPVPEKSACKMCPATQPHELEAMVRQDPSVGYMIMDMELNAKPNLKKIEGLWRKATKKRPGAMTPFILDVLERMRREQEEGVRRSVQLRVLREDEYGGCGSLAA